MIGTFDNLDDLFDALEAAELAANDRATTEQKMILPGTYYKQVSHGIKIYGYCLTMEEALDVPMDEEERAWEEESFKDRMRRGYMFVKAYSIACHQGELGDTHISVMTPITKEEFEAARKNGWC